MKLDSTKVWEVMNDLEMITSKICSAREIIDVTVEAIQKHDYDKAETLAMAAYEFLGYYLEEFDNKFKKAWRETVIAEREYYEGKVDDGMRPWGHSDMEYAITNSKKPLSCDKDDPSPECQGAWDSFWFEHNKIKADGYSVNEESYSEHYYDYTRNDPNRKNPFVDKVTKWVLPVEECKDADTDKTEYFVSFPDDLLEASNLKEGDQIEWVDQGDGSYLLRKVTRPLGIGEC
jgi:hypothetical protein